jgi:prepilin-type processing-associated H-X9-DG protein
VVIAIIAILAAILFPVFAQAREAARKTSCLNNLKQIGTATMLYTQDYDETMPAWNQGVLPGGPGCCPTALYWDSLILPYVKNGNPGGSQYGGVWRCASSQGATNLRTYGYSQVLMREGWETNTNGTAYRAPSIAILDAPASTIFVGDGGSAGRLAPPWWGQTSFTRGGTSSVKPGAGTTSNTQWEWPDRHQGGANYVFCDGHAKYLKDSAAFPPGMDQPRVIGKAAYKACVDYFAATASERAWCLSKS